MGLLEALGAKKNLVKRSLFSIQRNIRERRTQRFGKKNMRGAGGITKNVRSTFGESWLMRA